MRIVSIGNGDRENEEYAIPSLSVVALPMEQMASECLSLLLETVADPQKACESRELPVSYIERESCGGIRTDAPLQEGPPCCDPLP
jgi:DNA-binding LacI/PurR family transcriptional regulator